MKPDFNIIATRAHRPLRPILPRWRRRFSPQRHSALGTRSQVETDPVASRPTLAAARIASNGSSRTARPVAKNSRAGCLYGTRDATAKWLPYRRRTGKNLAPGGPFDVCGSARADQRLVPPCRIRPEVRISEGLV
ncbi:unnamed protein product, partial [Iphiclides podalirius]